MKVSETEADKKSRKQKKETNDITRYNIHPQKNQEGTTEASIEVS